MATVFPAPPEGCPPGFTYQEAPQESGILFGGLRPVSIGPGRATCFRSDEGSVFEALAEGFQEFPHAISEPEFLVGLAQTGAFAVSALSGPIGPIAFTARRLGAPTEIVGPLAILGAGIGELPMPNGFDFSSFLPDLDFGDIIGQGITQIGLPLLGQELGLAARPPMGVPNIRSSVPAVIPPGMGMMMGRFASRFPNLAGVLTVLRWSRTKAWDMLRKIGPAGLITLGFTAEAINELISAGPGRRKMNVLNPRALSRSTRRLIGFQRRAARVSSALAGVCRGRSRARGRRCPTCRSTPCRC